jgi:Lon protease-like protein
MRVPLFPFVQVLVPGAIMPLHIFEDRYKKMLRTSLGDRQPFGIALLKEDRSTNGPGICYPVGTLARIIQVDEVPEGRCARRHEGNCYNILCLGEARFRITSIDRRAAEYLVAEAEPFPDESAPAPALMMVGQRVAMLFDEYYRKIVALMGDWQREAAPGERTLMFDGPVLEEKLQTISDRSLRPDDEAPRISVSALPEDPTAMSYTVASELNVDATVKQDLLETPSALVRLQREAEVLAQELPGLDERIALQYRRRLTGFGMTN